MRRPAPPLREALPAAPHSPSRARLRTLISAHPPPNRYGYTRDYCVEQLYRDNRLNMIHEGTAGIQAMDLLGRTCAALCRARAGDGA